MSVPRVWFPAIRAGSGTDVFTQRLADALNALGIRAAITWLPHHAEYVPWGVPIPKPPNWANIVHINTWLHPRFIPRHLPVVATMHHVVHDPAFAPYRTAAQALYHTLWIKPIEAAVLRRANAVTAVSQYTAAQLRAVFHHELVTVIPNGIDTDLFRPGLDRQPHHPFRLLFVGNFSRRKGVDLLAPIMRALGSDYELWVIGGLRRGRFKAFLPPNVRWLGRMPTTQALVGVYQDVDALLLPSRLEGFGLVALEAQACGVPVIATRGSALPEVVQTENGSYLCPQDDVAAFVSACRAAKDAALLWRSVRSAVVERIKSHFALDRIARCYVELYCSLLSDSHNRAHRNKPLAGDAVTE